MPRDKDYQQDMIASGYAYERNIRLDSVGAQIFCVDEGYYEVWSDRVNVRLVPCERAHEITVVIGRTDA